MVVWKKRGSRLAGLKELIKDPAYLRKFVIVGALAVVGVIVIFVARAATSTISLEAETAACGSLSKTAANASGGAFTRFRSGGCGTQVVNCSGLASGSYCWKRVGLGAGGYLTGIDVGINGELVARSDAQSAVYFDGTKWVPLVTFATLPADEKDKSGLRWYAGTATTEVSIYDKNRIYIRLKDEIYRADFNTSINNWQLTNVTTSLLSIAGSIHSDPNINESNPYYVGRSLGSFMAVSKTNKDILYVVGKNGVFRTSNAGTSWTKVFAGFDCSGTDLVCGTIAINDAEDNVYFFANTSKGNAANDRSIFAGKVSTGDQLSVISGQTIYPVKQSVYNGTDTIYAVASNNGAGKLYTLKNRVLTEISNPLSDADTVAANKNGKVAVTKGTTEYAISNDKGATWPTKVTGATEIQSDIPWFNHESSFVPGFIEYDGAITAESAFVGDRLWQTIGIGMQYRDPTTPANTWIGLSNGIENMIGNQVRSFVAQDGSSRSIFTQHDRLGWLKKWTTNISQVENLPSQPIIDSRIGYVPIRHGNSINVSPNGKYVVGLSENLFDYDTKSTAFCSKDGGQTYKLSQGLGYESAGLWQDYSPVRGTVAVNDSGQAIIVPTAAGVTGGTLPAADLGIRTFNCEDTANEMAITKITLASMGLSHPNQNFGGYQGINQNFITVDAANNFYMMLAEANESNFSVYKLNTYPSSWSKLGSVTDMASAKIHGIIKAVPGKAGDLFIASGDSNTSNSQCGPKTWFRSGNTFTQLTSLSEIIDVGFGMAATGKTYPTIYVSGCVNNVFGIFASEDFNPSSPNSATWSRIDFNDSYKNFQADYAISLDGDKKTPGCVYVLFGASNAVYGCKK